MTSRVLGVLTAIGLCLGGCNRSDLSSLPGIQNGDFRAQPYLRAAERLQALGQKEACKRLLGADVQDPVIVLCRMLFTRRAVGFRRPLIGAASFLGDTDYPDWPLEPIEIIDGVPFLMTQGTMLGGVPESAQSYLHWCMAHCDWNPVPYRPMSAQEGRDALAKLIGSGKWKRPLHPYEKEFLSAQLK
jgi:hypothetical protein